jgi:thiopeptide-type bacteriocin biosynthesis protein
MRDDLTVAKSVYENTGLFLLRMPLLSVEDYFSIEKETVALTTNNWNSYHAQMIKHALMTSSYDIYTQLILDKEEKQRLREKMFRYLIRMSTRATPYGMLAGFSFGSMDSKSKLNFKSRTVKLWLGPDMGWFIKYLYKIQKDSRILTHLIIFSNPLMVADGNILINLDTVPNIDEKSEELVYLNATMAIKEILDKTKKGVAVNILLSNIAKKYKVKEQLVLFTIIELLDKNILYTDLIPNLVNMANPLEYTLNLLKNRRIMKNKLIDNIFSFKNNIHSFTFDNNFKPASTKDFEQWYNEIKNIIENITEEKQKNILHIDSEYILDKPTVSKKIMDSVELAASLKIALDSDPNRPKYLAGYIEKFKERFGNYKSVKFHELINPVTGLGMPKPYDYIQNKLNKAPLLEFILGSLNSKNAKLKLSDKNAETLIKKLSRIKKPVSVCLFATIIAKSQDNIDKGKFKIILNDVQNYEGAINGLGRFLYTKESSEAIKKIYNKEKQNLQNWLEVELVTIPKLRRLSNVSTRFIPYEYSVSYLVKSPQETINIPIDELMVRVENNKFFISWKDKDILLKQSSMLNRRYLPNSMRLLLDLSKDSIQQYQNSNLIKNLNFLPRIEYKNIILVPAQWSIKNDGRVDTKTFTKFSISLKKFVKEMYIPNYVLVADKDNKLLLNLNSTEALTTLYKIVKTNFSKGIITILQEGKFRVEASPLLIHGKHYANEIVVPLVLKYNENNIATAVNFSKSKQITTEKIRPDERIKLPFDEWLSINLYINPILANKFISHQLMDFVDNIKNSKGFKKWFFIRYEDPDFHIRLRIKAAQKLLLGEVVSKLHEWLKSLTNNGFMIRASINTYEREIERYGGPKSISLLEDLFYLDSEISAGVLYASSENMLNIVDLTLLAAYTFDKIMDNLGVGINNRVQFYRNWSNDTIKYPTNNFKNDLKQLILLKDDVKYNDSLLESMLFFGAKQTKKIGEKLVIYENKGLLLNNVDDILRSYLHMHCNRLIGINRNAENAVLILLKRYTEQCMYKNKANLGQMRI